MFCSCTPLLQVAPPSSAMLELFNASAALSSANTTHAPSSLPVSEDTLTPLCWVLPLGLLVSLLLLRAQRASYMSTCARSQAVGSDKASKCPFAHQTPAGQARTEEHAGVQVQVRTYL
jgi:hypothetical protein